MRDDIHVVHMIFHGTKFPTNAHALDVKNISPRNLMVVDIVVFR